MKIVIDSNIFISSLLKDGKIREIITFNVAHALLFPETILEEIKEHKQELLEKSGLSEEEFEDLISKLLNYVIVVPFDKIKIFEEEAKQIIGNIDKDDVSFIAASLANDSCSIWSDDRHFKQQAQIPVLTTEEILIMTEEQSDFNY